MNAAPTKNDRRTAARETARVQREAQKKRESRNRWFLRTGIGVGLIAVAAIVAMVVVGGIKPAGPGPLNMASDGLIMEGDGGAVSAVSTKALAAGAALKPTDVGSLSGSAQIVVYLDYLCPYCNQFEVTNAEQMAEWVAEGTATLETHPISILDQASNGSKYSTRAANAAACVADYDPDKFLDVNGAVFAAQPTEGTTGLTNAELVSLVEDAGVADDAVAECITSLEFGDWVGAATERARKGPLPNSNMKALAGTPTVIVNGIQYTGAVNDAAEFKDFVDSREAAGSVVID